MTVRTLALVLVVVLAVPAALALLRPGRAGDDPGEPTTPRPLDAVWALVPIVLLAALIVLSVTA